MFRGQTKKIVLAESFFQMDPHNENLQNALSVVQTIIMDGVQQDMEDQSQEVGTRWVHFGDTYLRTFFQFHRPKQRKPPCKVYFDGDQELNT
jgi:hypothetical protein